MQSSEGDNVDRLVGTQQGWLGLTTLERSSKRLPGETVVAILSSIERKYTRCVEAPTQIKSGPLDGIAWPDKA